MKTWMPGCSVFAIVLSPKSLGAGPSRGCHRCPTPLVARHLTRQVQRLRHGTQRGGTCMAHRRQDDPFRGSRGCWDLWVESTRSEGTQCPNRPSVWPASLVESARDTKSRDNSSRRLPDDPLRPSSSVVNVEQRA